MHLYTACVSIPFLYAYTPSQLQEGQTTMFLEL